MNMKPDVVYNASIGKFGMGDLHCPGTPPPPKGYPLVMTIHGGGWSSMTRDSFAGVASWLADNGWAAFNIDYRLAPENRFPAALDDCLAAAQFLLQGGLTEPLLDCSRLSVLGVSAGGHLALMCGLSLPPEKVAALVSISGICDVFPDFALFPERYEMLWGHLPDTRELMQMNPAPIFRHGAPPMLCTHFYRDSVVPVQSSLNFVQAVAEKGGDVSTYLYDLGRDQQGHAIWIPESSPHRLLPDLEAIILAFLKLHDPECQKDRQPQKRKF